MIDGYLNVVKKIVSSNISRIVQEQATASSALAVEDEEIKRHAKPNMLISLLAGAAAGVVVDISLYPLDTLKTRLQSKVGFLQAGGFRGVYKGINLVMIGSAPSSATFFCSYNGIINYMKERHPQMSDIWIHFYAASAAELFASIVRTPLELLKQKKQTTQQRVKSIVIAKNILQLEGIFGLYRGFITTVAREIPFAALQFPLWEYFKKLVSRRKKRPCTMLETAFCGSAAGFISAAITTPMDVIKTRTMLASYEEINKYKRLVSLYVARDVYMEKGLLGFFAGIVPRVLWISVGGFIYFGVYEGMKIVCEKQPWIPVRSSEDNAGYLSYSEMKELEIEKVDEAQTSPNYDVWDEDYSHGSAENINWARTKDVKDI